MRKPKLFAIYMTKTARLGLGTNEVAVADACWADELLVTDTSCLPFWHNQHKYGMQACTSCFACISALVSDAPIEHIILQFLPWWHFYVTQ